SRKYTRPLRYRSPLGGEIRLVFLAQIGLDEFSIPMNEELLAKCSCSHCGNHLEFPLEGAGAIIACPHCGQETQLTLEAPPQSDKPSAAELLAGFTGPIRRPRVSFFYQTGLILVTFVMLILPV